MPVGSRSLAERILAESKRAASSHDPQQLRQEKSLLIKDINNGLAESRRFYDIKIENYRLFATVQTVLNEWRGKDKLDLTTRAMYEEQLVDWLARSTGENLQEKMDIDPLVQKLMYQKFESKYKEQLSESQKKILECSILGTDSEFIEIIKETKIRALSELDAYEKVCDNRLLKENIGGVRKSIESLPEEKNDVVIAKTLHLVHLIEEMKTDER
jgi:hypothetical protein